MFQKTFYLQYRTLPPPLVVFFPYLRPNEQNLNTALEKCGELQGLCYSRSCDSARWLDLVTESSTHPTGGGSCQGHVTLLPLGTEAQPSS